MVIGALAYGIFQFNTLREAGVRFQRVKFKPMTSVGNAEEAAVSPDGKFIAYTQNEGGKYTLWVKAVATGSAVQIASPPDMRAILAPSFSPDGNHVYFSMQEQSARTALYQVPVLGGIPKKMTGGVVRAAFSPDGARISYVAFTGMETRLIVSSADGSDKHVLMTRSRPAQLSLYGGAWSPDGKVIAVGVRSAESGNQYNLVGVSVDGGAVAPLSAKTWSLIGPLAWLGDGSGLVFVGAEGADDKEQIWRVSLPGGAVLRVTNDLRSYGPGSLSLTADNHALVTTQAQHSSAVYVTSSGDSAARQPVSKTMSSDGRLGLA